MEKSSICEDVRVQKDKHLPDEGSGLQRTTRLTHILRYSATIHALGYATFSWRKI